MNMRATPSIPAHAATLGSIAWRNLQDNNLRVANALHELLTELVRLVPDGASQRDRAAMLREFRQRTRWAPAELADELLTACLNTGQYDRALDACATIARLRLLKDDDLLEYRAELLIRSGHTEEGERLLLDALDRAPDDPWSYVRLGDASYVWVVQDEHWDLECAEDWYYRGYDRGLATTETIGGRALLERLGDVCVARLRRDAERRLLHAMEQLDIGGWETLAQFRAQVRRLGNDCVFFHHLQDALMRAASSAEDAERNVAVLADCYNLTSQDALDGRSPFEMVAEQPLGPHAERFRTEMLHAFELTMDPEQSHASAGARFSEQFSEFQLQFYVGMDPVTGKRRRDVIADEERAMIKQRKRDKYVWTGFLEYRRKP